MTSEDLDQKIEELHAFWFKPPVLGQPSRAEQIDTLLTLTRNSKFTFRAALWIASAILALMTAVPNIINFLRNSW